MPLFTVGVTTYNRKALLTRCLDSLTKQSFGDFEVIVGNDYQPEPLSPGTVGVADPRIRVVNHPQNLGELRNLNALLAEAKGRYFTWQFDDDLYAPDFLERTHAALKQGGWPACAFTSYEKVFDARAGPSRARGYPGDAVMLSGSEFLRRYLGGQLRAMGLTGVFETAYLRSAGGAQALTDGPWALYSEYLQLVRTVLLDRVAYIDAPLVYYFVHEGSWGNINAELDLYRQAGTRLLAEALPVLEQAGPASSLRSSVEALVRLVVEDFVKHACVRPGLSGLRDAKDFSRGLTTRFLPNGAGRGKAGGAWFVVPFLKAKLKRLLPKPLRVTLQRIHARFQ